MTRIKDVVAALEAYAPLAYAQEWDNCGLLLGRAGAEISAALVALDITGETVDEAREMGAGLIVSHHPLFFSLKRITDESFDGRRVLKLAESGIAACCMHTNLDAAERGVNDCLLRALGLPEPYMPLAVFTQSPEGRDIGEGLFCELERERDAAGFASEVGRALGCQTLRFHACRPVRRVGVCSGSGGDVFAQALRAGCDTFITGDVKHSLFLEAAGMGVNLIDAGHFRTENVVCAPVARYLAAAFPELRVRLSEACGEPFVCL